MSSKNSHIINWEKLFSYADTFQNNKPCKWAFIEDFFQREFYDQLYETFPKFDDSWGHVSAHDKDTFQKLWRNQKNDDIPTDEEDHKFSKPWNEFHHYLFTDEFIQNIRKFSGVPVGRLKHFSMKVSKKGGYQSPHIHNVGPSTLIFMVYFSKSWEKGDPGGTYLTPEEDESKMIFEPYNLDNSTLVFQDGPYAGHGVRYIEKDVERRAIQIYLEGYSADSGWSSRQIKHKLKEI